MSWIDPDSAEWREAQTYTSQRMADMDAEAERDFSHRQDEVAAAGWPTPRLGVDESVGGFSGVTGYANICARGD